MERSGYHSDVSDKQRERLQECLPETSTRGAHLHKWKGLSGPTEKVDRRKNLFLVWMESKTQHRL